MDYTIDYKPSYTLVDVALGSGEKIVTDSGAMAWMEGPITVETSTRGGLLTGLKRKFMSGESFFQNTYTATGDGAHIALAPGPAGDIVAHSLVDEELYLEKGAYLASDPGVVCDAKYSGLLKGFMNEGVFVLKCRGTGLLFFHAYGDIQLVEVDGTYVVDNGYAVAWEPSLDYTLTRARKIRSFLFGDQLLLKFAGRGKVWVQSRSPRSLANWVHPFRRVQRNNN